MPLLAGPLVQPEYIRKWWWVLAGSLVFVLGAEVWRPRRPLLNVAIFEPEKEMRRSKAQTNQHSDLHGNVVNPAAFTSAS